MRRLPGGALRWVCGALVLATIGARAAATPAAWTWDLIPYVGMALEWDRPVAEAQAEAYAAVAAAVPPAAYRDFTTSGPYRRAVAEDPAAFDRTMALYRQRALYGVAVRVGMAFGTATEAAANVARLAWVGLAAVFYLAGQRGLGPIRAGLAAVLLAHAPPLVGEVAHTTPDLLGGMLLAAGVAAWPRWRGVGFAALLAAALTRPDLALPGAAIALASVRAGWRPAVGAAAGLIGAAAAVTAWSGHPGWWALIWFTFVNRTAEVAPGPLTWAKYASIFSKNAAGLDGTWAIVAAAPAAVLRGDAGLRAIALVAAFAVRFAMFPAMWDRLLVPLLAAMVVVVLGAIPPRAAD